MPFKRSKIREIAIKYPFLKMEVGDSFFVGKEKLTTLRNLRIRVQMAARRYVLRHAGEVEFTSRIVYENEVWGVRIWRIK